MICPCKCHQMPEEKSSCGDCNNTGILIINKTTDPITIPLNQKLMYPKGAKDLTNAKTIEELL